MSIAQTWNAPEKIARRCASWALFAVGADLRLLVRFVDERCCCRLRGGSDRYRRRSVLLHQRHWRGRIRELLDESTTESQVIQTGQEKQNSQDRRQQSHELRTEHPPCATNRFRVHLPQHSIRWGTRTRTERSRVAEQVGTAFPPASRRSPLDRWHYCCSGLDLEKPPTWQLGFVCSLFLSRRETMWNGSRRRIGSIRL